MNSFGRSWTCERGTPIERRKSTAEAICVDRIGGVQGSGTEPPPQWSKRFAQEDLDSLANCCVR
ncbi:hypothetical protein J2798_002903 [Herbaspirillum seropedicae]|nr:hypothetical protein [Herbaspirillum seropedicae]